MGLVYFASKISNNISQTPEGFLLCRNVPIGRTGEMSYLGEEINAPDKKGQEVSVFRNEDELFNKATMASFEGKIVTNGHPPDLLTCDNAQRYAKGTVQNVRRSKDEDDLLLADLMLYEKKLIEGVQNGKREVSCGYDCVYTANEDGTYNQTSIRGNHVAVVEAGRAGNRVSIKDSLNKEGEVKNMDKPTATQKILMAMGLKSFAKDAEPEELAGVVDSMNEKEKEPKEEESMDEETAGKPSEMTMLAEKMDQIISLLSAGSRDEKEPEEAIDEVLEEIEVNDEGESEVVEDEEIPSGEVSDPASRPENPIPNADSMAWKSALKAMKPVIAAIPNRAERRKATDSLINEYRKATKAPKNNNAYAKIVNAQKQQALDMASKNKSMEALAAHNENLGDAIAKKYNANLKGVK